LADLEAVGCSNVIREKGKEDSRTMRDIIIKDLQGKILQVTFILLVKK